MSIVTHRSLGLAKLLDVQFLIGSLLINEMIEAKGRSNLPWRSVRY